MSVCIISFSSRQNGNCIKIGRILNKQFPNSELYSFSEFLITPCGNCEYQCFNGGSNCPYFDDKEYNILTSIINSNIAYFIVPNYCDFPCSNFFTFNERSLCLFQNNATLLSAYLNIPKKFIVVSNTNTQNFETAFSYYCNRAPQILYLSSRKYNRASIDGNLLESKQAVTDIMNFISQ